MRKAFILLPILAMALFASCNKSINRVPTDTGASKAPVKGTHSTGTTYYVDPAGSDSNDGQSTTTAWQSISKVNTQTFLPGDQILFKASGSWSGQLLPKGSGSSGSPIVIDMYGTGNKPVINGSGADTTGAVKLIGQSYWQIKNLEVTNKQTAGGTSRLYGIHIKTATSTAFTNVQILNCFVHDVNSYTTESNTTLFNKGTGGIIVGGNNSEVLIKGCHVKDVTVEGIRNTGGTCSHILIDSNLIENVYGDGIVLNGVNNNSAITRNVGRNLCYNTNTYNYAGMWTSNSVGTLVAYNEISGITGGGANDGEPFDADLGVSGDIFEYNYTHDNKRGFMLFMHGTSNVTVRYNISVNDIGDGKRLFFYDPGSHTNIKIYNNTFFITGNVAQLFYNDFNNTSNTTEFSNNIVYCTGTVAKFSQNGTSANCLFRNNCFYPQSMTSVNGPAAGTMSGSVYSDPKFVSAASGATTNFNLQSTSPCLNMGVVMGSNGGIDYYGTALPAGAPDIGFYQHPSTGTTSTLNATADAYVRDGSYATTNYGTLTYTVVKSDAVGYARKAYEKFDFSSVPASSVQAATLSLYVNGVNTAPTRTISVYTTQTESWGETSINWNNAPTDTTYVGQIVVTGVGTYALDVKNAINAQLAKSDHIVSFLLQNNGPNSSTNDITLNSREASSNQPALTVIY